MFPVSLTGPSLTLREMQPDDVEALHSVYGDATTVEHLSFTPRTVTQCSTVIDSAMKDAKADPRTVYMLAAEFDGRLVGAARMAQDERPHSAQIGFAIRHDFWGRGLGAELVELLLRLGFQQLPYARIWGARSPDNPASQAVMNRAGMVEEGRIRRHLRTETGWRDSIVHSVLSEEWSA